MLDDFTTPKSKIGRPAKKGKISPKTLDRRIKETGILSKLISLSQESGLEVLQTLGYLGRKFYLNKAYGEFYLKKDKCLIKYLIIPIQFKT